VFNQLVAKWKSGEKYSRKDFQKFCSTMRQETEWMRQVSSRATYEAADNFHEAVSNFFRDCKKAYGRKAKPPRFKKKGVKDSFQFSHSAQFRVNGRSLRIQGLKEQIRMRERIRLTGAVKSVTIKLYAGKWYASFLVETEDKPKSDLTQKPSVGIDFGLGKLAVLSNGEVIENPRPLEGGLRLLRNRQRQASRKFVSGRKQQSNRYKRAVARVSKIHKKVADIRSEAQHKFTSDVVKRFSKITIEDLNVSGMQKNRKLARAISDASWSTLRWQLEYKSKWAGVELVVADRFYASSKTCSNCNHKVDKLSLSQRTFSCPCCGLSLDRDLDAAINLDRYDSTTGPIRASRKTDGVELCKTTSVAGLFDAVNINSTNYFGGSLSSSL
jgi:putative transposase